MGHPDEGVIRAFLDHEVPGERESIRTHLANCTRCRELAEGQAGALDRVTDALFLLDVEPPVERARLRVLEAEAGLHHPPPTLRRYLPRAASFLVLLTAGTAAALPGSPVREWVVKGWEAVSGSGRAGTGPTTSLEEGPTPESLTSEHPSTVGATLTATVEGVELQVSGFSEGASLRVVLVEGDRAGIFAGEGTRFRSETRRLEASDPPGDVTVEIPRGATTVTLTVNGEVYLEKTKEGLELLGPVQTRSPTEIRFGPSGGDPNAQPPTG